MSLYQKIKSAITVRQVGEMYGMEPDRHGMVCCPFHSDSDPSMKLNDTYYYCFGCGANGDAIDLTAKLFDLNPRQAAEKLAHDFGLDPDKPPANAIAMPPPKRGLTDEQWADIAYCLRVLTDYIPNVARMKDQLRKYNVAFTKTAAENEKLKEKNKTLSASLDKAKKGSVLKRLEDAKLRQDYEAALKTLDSIPPEVIRFYENRTQEPAMRHDK